MAVPKTPDQIAFEKMIGGIWRLLSKLIKERAHGEIIISVRDGQVQLVREQRSYLPGNLPEN